MGNPKEQVLKSSPRTMSQNEGYTPRNVEKQNNKNKKRTRKAEKSKSKQQKEYSPSHREYSNARRQNERSKPRESSNRKNKQDTGMPTKINGYEASPGNNLEVCIDDPWGANSPIRRIENMEASFNHATKELTNSDRELEDEIYNEAVK